MFVHGFRPFTCIEIQGNKILHCSNIDYFKSHTMCDFDLKKGFVLHNFMVYTLLLGEPHHREVDHCDHID